MPDYLLKLSIKERSLLEQVMYTHGFKTMDEAASFLLCEALQQEALKNQGYERDYPMSKDYE